MEPKVIFEDDDLIVLDKPFGITVNRSETTEGERTVQEWIEKYLKVRKVSKVSEVSKKNINEAFGTFGTFPSFDTFVSRSGIVHRIDKETSGILLVAKTKKAFENLQAQFKERKVKKTYIALVHGQLPAREGEIRVPIGRLPWDRTKFGVLPGGKESVTRYKVIAGYTLDANHYTLIEAYPETGRTHQIRVHLKYFGHPIFSDFLYAGKKTAKNDRKFVSRVFLHASKISFYHPKTNELVSFESPLPTELKTFLDSLN